MARFLNAPCCDDCWFGWDGHTASGVGVDEDGSVRFPFRLVNSWRKLETCHFCGFTTYSGTYVRTDVDEKPAHEPQIREEAP